MQRFTFSKEERLCSKQLLEELFSGGKSLFSFPFKVIYLQVEPQKASIQVVFSVPKRNFKHAVKRNLLRRRMREAFRLHKHDLIAVCEEAGIGLTLMFIYIDKVPQDYLIIEKGMVKSIEKLAGKIKMEPIR